MFDLLWLCVGAFLRLFGTRQDLLENLALCQQLAVLKRKHRKPRLVLLDRLFWVIACRLWPNWKNSLLLVTPDTVFRVASYWFPVYWTMLCRVRKHVGGKRTSRQVRDLIFQMVAENPSWSAPRIHGQLLMLGFELSERTVSRWMRRTPRGSESGQRWLAFLRNHCEAIAAMDFFTVPTITFKLLYCFFINY